MIDTNLMLNHGLYFASSSTILWNKSWFKEHRFPSVFIVGLSGSYSIGLPVKWPNNPPKATIKAYPGQVSHLWLQAPI